MPSRRRTDPRARLLVEILTDAGLRFGDASRLRVDCLVRDQQGAPYLRYRNHEMRRERPPGAPRTAGARWES